MAVTKKNKHSLILLMTFSVFSALVAVPNAAAIEQFDLATYLVKILKRIGIIHRMMELPFRRWLRIKDQLTIDHSSR